MNRADLIQQEVKQNVEFTTILVLDSSGSMSGNKYNKAVEGLKKIANEVRNGYFIEFSSNVSGKEFKNGVIENRFIGGSTALNDAILHVKDIVFRLNENKKCLINVFTDGEENGSRNTIKQAIEAIQDIISDKHTFTFICTKEDYKTVINTYKVPESNVLSYENNAKGVEEAYTKTLQAVSEYSKSLANGEDVTLGFYSKVLK